MDERRALMVEEAKRLGLDHTNERILVRLWFHYNHLAA